MTTQVLRLRHQSLSMNAESASMPSGAIYHIAKRTNREYDAGTIIRFFLVASSKTELLRLLAFSARNLEEEFSRVGFVFHHGRLSILMVLTKTLCSAPQGCVGHAVEGQNVGTMLLVLSALILIADHAQKQRAISRDSPTFDDGNVIATWHLGLGQVN